MWILDNFTNGYCSVVMLEACFGVWEPVLQIIEVVSYCDILVADQSTTIWSRLKQLATVVAGSVHDCPKLQRPNARFVMSLTTTQHARNRSWLFTGAQVRTFDARSCPHVLKPYSFGCWGPRNIFSSFSQHPSFLGRSRNERTCSLYFLANHIERYNARKVYLLSNHKTTE